MTQKHSGSLPPIRVLDGVMGVGKTQATKRMINNLWIEATRIQQVTGWSDQFPRVLFVTPFVEETLKIVDDCPNLNFRLPDKELMGSKAAHIEHLIKRGENIATTHVLFSRLSAETCQALSDHNYMLVIDEAVESVQVYDKLSRGDVKLLFGKELMTVEEGGRLLWTGDDALNDTRYEDVRSLCRAKSMSLYGESAIIWELPLHILKNFASVMVLTYLWEASAMCAFFAAEGVPVEIFGIVRVGESHEPKPRSECNEVEVKAYIRKHLHVIDSRRANAIGDAPKRTRRDPKEEVPKRALSSSWFKAATPVQRETLSRKIENFAKNGPATIDKFAWTVFAADREKIERSRFAREECWIPVNARASNNFKHKTHMAYCVDIYLHPNTSNYLRSRGVFISADLYALSEMIQWIWRGCIRCLDGQDMTVYVPSERMRKLLRLWVSCDSIGELYEKLGVPLR